MPIDKFFLRVSANMGVIIGDGKSISLTSCMARGYDSVTRIL